MHFEGALVKEQNVTFAIVVVKPEVLNYSTRITDARNQFGRYFPRVPLILRSEERRVGKECA